MSLLVWILTLSLEEFEINVMVLDLTSQDEAFKVFLVLIIISEFSSSCL